MADLGGGQQGQHTVHHAQAGAQNGHQGQLAAGQHIGVGHGDGSLDLHFFQGQVTGGFVAQQGCQLAHQLLEFLGAGGFVAQQADLVLHQGMVENHRLFAHFVQRSSMFISRGSNKPDGRTAPGSKRQKMRFSRGLPVR